MQVSKKYFYVENSLLNNETQNNLELPNLVNCMIRDV